MKINGEDIALEAPLTLSELLEREGYGTERVAVEKNRLIVPRAEYETTMIGDDDVLEIVRFVGGG